ncbi:tRNA dihydrouridine synthase [Savitreella phatthalungensis]
METAADGDLLIRDGSQKSPVLELLQSRLVGREKRPIYVAAPMVRYSKAAFRRVCLEFGTDIVYTPMILAKEFISHANARDADFTTFSTDSPLVVQFAANDDVVFSRACEAVAPYADGVGINCGCPQKWAIGEGIGAHLMSDPARVRDMVLRARSSPVGSRPGFCLETKIRIHKDLDQTLRWARTLEMAGIDYLVCHGRTPTTRSSHPCDFSAIKRVRQEVKCPVVANGDVTSVAVAQWIRDETNVEGVMAARALMANPAMFGGYARCPWSAIERLVFYGVSGGLHPILLQHHLGDMLDNAEAWTRKERGRFFDRKTLPAMLDWLDDHFILRRPGQPGFGQIDQVDRKVPLPMGFLRSLERKRETESTASALLPAIVT